MGTRESLTTASMRRRSAEMLSHAYAAHHRDLLAFARRRLRGDSSLAEEAVQETFLRAWRSLAKFDAGVGTMRMWLFAICRNAAADAARRQARHVRADYAAAWCDDITGDGALDRLADRWHVDAALRSLPAGQRDAIVQIHLCERSYSDTARDLGVPIGTVKSRVHLGLRSARQTLAA